MQRDSTLVAAVEAAFRIGGEAHAGLMAEPHGNTRLIVEAVVAALIEGWEVVDHGLWNVKDFPYLRKEGKLKHHVRRHSPHLRWTPSAGTAGFGALLLRGVRLETEEERRQRINSSIFAKGAEPPDWQRQRSHHTWAILEWVWSYPDQQPTHWTRAVAQMKSRIMQEPTEQRARGVFELTGASPGEKAQKLV
jgi:hypothetical protein